MEKLIGINPVTEALKNKKDIEYLEIFKGINEEKVKEIKELASKANIKIKKTDKREDNTQGVVAYIRDYDYYMDLGEFQEKLASEEKSIVFRNSAGFPSFVGACPAASFGGRYFFAPLLRGGRNCI